MAAIAASASASKLFSTESSASGDADPSPASSLRGRQLASIRQMLRLSSSSSSLPSSSVQSWKLLLYDRLGQDILSPVMNVKALRDEGVTLHLIINTDR